MIILSSDKVLRNKYNLAKKGLSAWKKITREVGAGNGVFVIFQPDGYSDEAVYSLTCLNQFKLTVTPERIVIITTNPHMIKFAVLFSENISVKVIDKQSSDEIMAYAQTDDLGGYFYIASFDQPYGRWGSRLIDQGAAGAEHCFAVGIYRVWDYRPEKLPSYSGNDQMIIEFLHRAQELQNRSIETDRKEMKKHDSRNSLLFIR